MAKPRQTKANKADKNTEAENDSEAMEVEVKKPVGRGRPPKPKEIVQDDVVVEEGPSKAKRARKTKADETEEPTKVPVVTKGKKKVAQNKNEDMDVDDDESTNKKTTKDDVIKKTGPKKQVVAQKNDVSADDEEEVDDDQEEEAPKAKRGAKKEPAKKPTVKEQKKNIKEKTPEEDDDELTPPTLPTQKVAGKRGRKAATPVVEIENVDDEVVAKVIPNKRGRKAATPVIENVVDDDAEEEEETVIKPPPAKRGRKPKEAKVEEEKEVVSKPVAKRGRKPAAAVAPVIEKNENDDEEEEEKEEVIKKPVSKRGRKPAVAPVIEKNENDEEEEEEVIKKPVSKRGRKAIVTVEAVEEKNGDDDEEEEEEKEVVKKPVSKRGRKAAVVVEVVEEKNEDEEENKTVEKDEDKKEIVEEKEEVKSASNESSNTDEKIESTNETNGTSENNVVEEKEKNEEVEKIVEETKEPSVTEPIEDKNGKTEVAASNDVDDDNDNNQEKEDEEKVEEVKKQKRGRKPATSTKTSTTDDNNSTNDNDEKTTTTTTTKKNKTETDLSSINFTCEKLNKNGDKYNIKICTWNVSGARAAAKKQVLPYFIAEDADIILLQEIKCTKDELIEALKIPNYKLYTEGATKGYAGVALYSKKEPINIKYGIDNYESNNESRLITAEYDNYYIVCSYHPNAGQKLKSLDKKLEWNKAFKEYIKLLDAKKPVIICGDLNVAHKEIDLKNPTTNSRSPGFTKDERDNMTELLSAGFIDTYRNLYPDKEGAYTFWNYVSNARSRNAGWRLDYFLTSKRIIDNVCDNVIRSEVYGSDHCPIVLYLNI